MMGSGKTTVGRLLAEHLGADLVDSDAQVEADTGRTVAEIWAQEGEPAFRRLEAAALRAALDPGRSRPAVVAAAGGVVLDEANRALLRDGDHEVVWLRAAPTTLAERVGDDPGHRPLLAGDPAGTLARLDGERRDLYAQVATLVVDVDSLDPVQIRDVIARNLSGAPRS